MDGVKQSLDQLVGSKKNSWADAGLECLPKALTMKNNIIAGSAASISPNDSSILMIM